MYFTENLPPILLFEVLGDLSKQVAQGRTSSESVKRLAQKFGGSGGIVNMDYMILAEQALLGADIPLTGQIVPDNWRTADGGRGTLVDLGPLNHALLRWREGRFTDTEEQLATLWRAVTRRLHFSILRDFLNRNDVVVPSCARDEIVKTAGQMADHSGLQLVWMDWLLREVIGERDARHAVRIRWHELGMPLIREFAPYAYHCMRVMLALVVAVANKHIGWSPTHLLDIQYLYYLPFCLAFSSNDRLHRLIAADLMQDDQVFVPGQELKRGLAAIVTHRDNIDEDQLRSEREEGGPPETEDRIVLDIWERTLPPGRWE